jgi:hypothetical protein
MHVCSINKHPCTHQKYTCTHAHTHTHPHIHTHTHIYTYVHTYTQTYMRTCHCSVIKSGVTAAESTNKHAVSLPTSGPKYHRGDNPAIIYIYVYIYLYASIYIHNVSLPITGPMYHQGDDPVIIYTYVCILLYAYTYIHTISLPICGQGTILQISINVCVLAYKNSSKSGLNVCRLMNECVSVHTYTYTS